MRRKEGEDSFVQGGLAGFKRNWDIFTEGALETLNWYALVHSFVFCGLLLMAGIMSLLQAEQ